MDIDLTPVIEASARKHFEDTAIIARQRGEELIMTLPPELRFEATAELEHRLDWDHLGPMEKRRIKAEHVVIANIMLPLIKEAILAPIRKKMDENDLHDSDGTLVANGFLRTDELRALIGEAR